MSPVNWGNNNQGGHHQYRAASVLHTKTTTGTKSVNWQQGWQDVFSVTMNAKKSNSVYHLTISGNAQGNGRGGNQSGSVTPVIRVLRGNSTINNGGGNNGWAGRSGDSGQNASNNYDAGLIRHTFTDSPGLNAGQNVNYKCQLKAQKSGGGNWSMQANFGVGTFGISGASLTVMEVD